MPLIGWVPARLAKRLTHWAIAAYRTTGVPNPIDGQALNGIISIA